MKLAAFLTVFHATEGQRNSTRTSLKQPRRPAHIIDQQYELTGRMNLNQDRFIFQWPQCEDMDCGKTRQQIRVC